MGVFRRAGFPVLAIATLAMVVLALASCSGTGGQHRGPTRSDADACPGADPCPYANVALIGKRAEGVLREPEAIALGAAGQVYVGDQFSYVVQRFSARGRFEGEWGRYGAANGQFGAVDGLAVDAHGDVYVVDSAHDRVQKFDSRGRFVTAWGSPGTGSGQFDFNGGGGPGSPPSGDIAVFGGHVYVADTDNNRIERFSLDGTHATVWRDIGLDARQARAFGPRGIAVTAHAVYVTDEGNRRIVMLDHHGRLLASRGGFGRGRGQYSDPFGVAVGAGGRVFVADNNNNRIVALDRRLRYLTAWRGRGKARLSFVRAVAADAVGHVYVADTGNNRIEVFDARGRFLRRWGVSGDAAGQLSSPMGVAADASGGSLVVGTFGSRSPIHRFSSSLGYLSSWSRGGGAIIGQHFFSPTAAAVAPDGSVWVTDRDNGVIRHLSRAGTFLAALGKAGRAPGRFDRPTGVTVDRAGRVYVADTANDRVQKFSARGRLLGVWGSAHHGRVRLSRPTAVAVGRNGRMYIADTGHNRVVVLGPHGSLLGAWGTEGTSPGRFRNPDGIAVDSRGRVFVSDGLNDRIEQFTSHGRLLARWGVGGTGAGEFSRPGGLSIDCRGDLLVADTRNNRVQVFRHVASPSRCSAPRA